MENESQNLLQERIKKLPPEVRDMLASDELHNKIKNVGAAHHLHIDQLETLEDEVILVMMGLSDGEDLAGQIVSQMSVAKPEADSIVNDLNSSIFLPVQDSMKKFAEQQAKEESASNTTPAEKSVVMPSQAAASNPVPINKIEQNLPAPVPPKPDLTQSTPASVAVSPAPAASATIPKIDAMLSEATVSLPKKVEEPKQEAPKPTPIYKADPYREPPE